MSKKNIHGSGFCSAFLEEALGETGISGFPPQYWKSNLIIKLNQIHWKGKKHMSSSLGVTNVVFGFIPLVFYFFPCVW